VYFFTVLFIVVFFAIPLPYYSVSPGTAIPLSDEPGHFFVVSSNVAMNRYAVWLGLTDNAFRTSPFIALLSLTSPNADLVPFPENYTFTSEQVKAYHDAEQEAGQVVARSVASAYLGKNLSANISLGVSGSSGSFILALELIQRFGETDLVQGRRIAGSGDLDKNGTILAIGHARQKAIAAHQAGMDLLLLPAGTELADPLVPTLFVTNVSDAIRQLETQEILS
jgi:PDZ domain-containing secreted protein